MTRFAAADHCAVGRSGRWGSRRFHAGALLLGAASGRGAGGRARTRRRQLRLRRAGGRQRIVGPGRDQLARGSRRGRTHRGLLPRRLSLGGRLAAGRSRMGPGRAGHLASERAADRHIGPGAAARRGADHRRLRQRLVSRRDRSMHAIRFARRKSAVRDDRVGRARAKRRLGRTDPQQPRRVGRRAVRLGVRSDHGQLLRPAALVSQFGGWRFSADFVAGAVGPTVARQLAAGGGHLRRLRRLRRPTQRRSRVDCRPPRRHPCRRLPWLRRGRQNRTGNHRRPAMLRPIPARWRRFPLGPANRCPTRSRSRRSSRPSEYWPSCFTHCG